MTSRSESKHMTFKNKVLRRYPSADALLQEIHEKGIERVEQEIAALTCDDNRALLDLLGLEAVWEDGVFRYRERT